MMRILLIAFAAFLAGCSGTSDIQDLQAFTQEIQAKPRGRIDPLPEFETYSAFVYGASALRSPFEAPVTMDESGRLNSILVEAPDAARPKEALEYFSLNELSLVGTLAKAEQNALSGLIRNQSGSVFRILVGNYIGKNHGKIVAIQESQVDIIEVVPNGSGGWISRPHTLLLETGAGAE